VEVPVLTRLRPLLLSACLAACALPAVAHDGQLWINTTVFGSVEDLAFFAEVQPRIGDNFSKLDQLILRPALGWKVNKDLTLYQGYAYVESFGAGNASVEDRSFQEVNWKIGTFEGMKLSSRTRFEQRWRSDGRDVAFRLRQNLRVAVPLTADAKGIAAVGSTETFFHLNDADWGPRAGFDQQRTFAGLEMPVGGQSTVELGYLNRLIENPGTGLRVDHVLSLNVFIRN
jgi:hypothetical protein